MTIDAEHAVLICSLYRIAEHFHADSDVVKLGRSPGSGRASFWLSDFWKPFLKVLEMGLLLGPDHDRVGVEAAIDLAGASDGVETASSTYPYAADCTGAPRLKPKFQTKKLRLPGLAQTRS